MGTSKTTTEVVTKPEPKARAKRTPKAKAAPKPVFVYDFYVHNARHVLKDWLDKGFIEILPEGGIEWAYTDDTPCYSVHGTAYPIKMWNTPEERFAPVLGVTPMEVPWFWSMTKDRHAAAISLL